MKTIRILALFAAAAISAAGACAQALPADGSEQWRWAVDARLPDSIGPGSCIDLSAATVTAAFQEKYRLCSDTLLCRTSGGRRDWYAVRPDGLWAVGSNDRSAQAACRSGLMHLPADWGAWAGSDTVRIRAAGMPDALAAVSCELECSPGCSFIFADGDTVPSTMLVTVRALEKAGGAESRWESRRWYAPGCPAPVVEWVRSGAPGSPSETVAVCPPSEQPSADGAPDARMRRAAAGAGQASRPGNGEGAGSGLAEGVSVTIAGGAIEARVGGDWPHGCSAVLFDAAGRVLRTADAAGRIDASGLPPGCYGVSVSYGAESASAKLRL